MRPASRLEGAFCLGTLELRFDGVWGQVRAPYLPVVHCATWASAP